MAVLIETGIARIRNRLDEAGGSYVGCSESDLEELCVAAELEKLPESYRRFMQEFGRGTSPSILSLDYEFPWILELQSPSDGDYLYNAPAGSLFVAEHQGYQALFLPTTVGDDPPVFHIAEPREIRRCFHSFSGWIAQVTLP